MTAPVVDPQVCEQAKHFFRIGLLALGRRRPPQHTIEENPCPTRSIPS